MSFNYTQTFTALGSVVKVTNEITSFAASTLMGSTDGLNDISTDFGFALSLIQGAQSAFTGFASSTASWNGTIKGYSDNLLASLQSALNCPNNSPSTILSYLNKQMIVDSQSIKKNTVSSSFTSGSSNIGNGTINISTLYEGTLNEGLKISCIQDQYTGASAGKEVFQVVGQPSQPVFSYLKGGNGNGPNITVADDSSNLLNGKSSFVAANWTIGVYLVSPTAAPTVSVAGTSGELQAGTYYLKVTATGTGGGETLASPESLQFTVTAGEIPTVTFPAAPSGWKSWNVYLTPEAGAIGTEVLYATGITTTTYNIAAFAQTNLIIPPSVNTAIQLNSTNVVASANAAYNTSYGILITEASQNLEVSQVINTSVNTIYMASVMVRTSAAPTSGSTLVINAGGNNLLSLDPSTLTSTWTRYAITFTTSSTQNNVEFLISLTGAVASGEIQISNPVLTQPYLFGGVGYSIFRGASNFRLGDYFSVTTTNDNAGVFQTWITQVYNLSLNSSASPTIADSLAA